MGLGPYPDVTLSDARGLANRERKKILQGTDPLTDKRARQIAACTNEVIRAEWSEFDLERKTWIVPTERMKSKRERRVPLSAAALSTFAAVRGRSNIYLFPGHKHHSHLSNAAMMQVLKRLGHSEITVHGFRSTFRDWCAESTNYPSDVAEMALAHALRDKTEAA